MGWVTTLGPDMGQVEYRLSGGCGCDADHAREAGPDARLDYRLRGERPLEWIGKGLAEVGITPGSVLDDDGRAAARALADGRDPRTGEQLVKPKTAVDPRAKLPASVLVAAVREAAARAGLTPAGLLGTPGDPGTPGTPGARGTSRAGRQAARRAARFARLERGVERAGEAHKAPVTDLRDIAEAAGVDLAGLYGADRVSEAERYAGARVHVGNRGYDLTLELPKSVSVLYALAPPEMALAIEDAYLEAVREAVAMVEDVAGYAMAGHHGDGRRARRLVTSGLRGWVTLHRSARPVDATPGDPHLHAHVTILNLVRAEDGEWRTVAAGGRDLHRHARVADALVEARLRAMLSERFGVRWERAGPGAPWEVAGIPVRLRRTFSRRNGQILRLAAAGAQEDTKTLAARSREAKDAETPQADVRRSWRHRAEAVVGDVGAMIAAAAPGPDGPGAGAVPAPEPVLPTAPAVSAAVFAPDTGLTAHRKVVSRAEVLAAVLEECGAGVRDRSQAETLADEVLAAGGAAVRLPDSGAVHLSNAARYTAADVLAAEAVVVEQARSRYAAGAAVVPAAAAELAVATTEAAQGWAFSAEQRAVLDRLLTAGHGVDCVIGVAGAGKTTLVAAAKAAWESQGLVVAGASTTAVAAANLAAEAGVPSRTIASWLLAVRDGRGLAGVDVLVVDEAAMVDDRAVAELLTAAARTGTKVVQIGDPQQLRAIGVGGGFAEAHRLVGGLYLEENRRQRDPRDRAALATWRTGERRRALAEFAGAGRVHAVHTAEQAHDAMLDAWWQARDAVPGGAHERLRGLLLLAPRISDVDLLNAGARHRLRDAGELGPETRYALHGGGELLLAAGDVVRVRRNDYRERRGEGPDVLNGYRAIVRDIDAARRVLAEWRRADADGGHRTERAWFTPEQIAGGALSHGYAMTVAAAQGLTCDRAWVYGIGADAGTLYPALTRAREATGLWLPLSVLEDDAVRSSLGEAGSAAELLHRAVDAYAATFDSDRPDTMVSHELAPPAPPAARPVPAPPPWRERPYGAVPDAELGPRADQADAAADRAERRAADTLAAAETSVERARAGAGPRVRVLHRRQDELARAAEALAPAALHRREAEAARRRGDALTVVIAEAEAAAAGGFLARRRAGASRAELLDRARRARDERSRAWRAAAWHTARAEECAAEARRTAPGDVADIAEARADLAEGWDAHLDRARAADVREAEDALAAAGAARRDLLDTAAEQRGIARALREEAALRAGLPRLRRRAEDLDRAAVRPAAPRPRGARPDPSPPLPAGPHIGR